MFIVPESVAQSLVSLGEAIEVVEEAFAMLAQGRSELFPVAQGHGLDPSGRFGVKLGLDGARGASGLKIGSYWPRNGEAGLANHASTTVLLDEATGFPLALIGATALTALRTAAADAVAVRRLARESAASLAVVGSGKQARHEALAIALVRDLSDVRVASRSAAKAQALAARLREDGLPARATEVERAVRDADIVVTVTPSRVPVLDDDWIAPGAHVSAMGADGPGKCELPLGLLEWSTLFADVGAQSHTIGEYQRLGAEVARSRVTTLGAVVTGEARGRTTRDEITVFDSSGMALQDLAIGALALERARARGLAIEVAS